MLTCKALKAGRAELKSLQTDDVALWSSLERLETSFKTAGRLTVQPLRGLQESFIRMYSRTIGGDIEYICIYVYLLTYWELLEYMKETQFPPLLSMK